MKSSSTKKTRKERKKEEVRNDENLKCLRDNLFKLTSSYTGSKLEELTGVPDASIGAIKNGDRPNPKIDNLISIAKGLNCSIDYLVGLTSVKERDWKNTDKCIDLINKKTGLSVKALNRVIFQLNNHEIEALDELLTSVFVGSFLSRLHEYLFNLFPDDSISFEDYSQISIADIYKYILAFDLENIKKYSDSSVQSYKLKIEELEEIRKGITKNSRDYDLLSFQIESLKEIIHERSVIDLVESELKRPLSHAELREVGIKKENI